MKFSDILKLSTRMFKARTSRTLLTILGMGVGIGAILFLVSLGYGLQRTLLEKITTEDSLLTLDVSEVRGSGSKLNDEKINEIKSLEGVNEVSPAFQMNVQGHLTDLSSDMYAFGAGPTFVRLEGIKIAAGKQLSDDYKEGVIISKVAAQVFGKNEDEILGQDITFTFFLPKSEEATVSTQEEFEKVEWEKTYKIIGVIDGEEESLVYINLASLEGLDIKSYNQLKVKFRSSDMMDQARGKIMDSGFIVSSISDTVDQANKIFRAIQIILMLFGLVALIVSAIGMFNTMTIALLERTEEIGIMKSIGASDAAISLMFIMESAIMGFLGGLGGVVMGFTGGVAFNFLINFIAVRFGGEKVTIFYSPLWFILTIIGFAAIVGFFTGIVPARRASKIDPLDALRYK